MQVGERLKKARKQKGYTLAALAEKTGLSVSYISNVEREATSPTLQNLNQICGVLGIHIADFLAEAPENRPWHLPRAGFEKVFSVSTGVRYELALCGRPSYKCVCITIEPGCTRKEFSQGLPEDNFLLVTQGTLEVEMEGERAELGPEDLALIPAGTPHSYRSRAKEGCVSYWFALSPAEF